MIVTPNALWSIPATFHLDGVAHEIADELHFCSAIMRNIAATKASG